MSGLLATASCRVTTYWLTEPIEAGFWPRGHRDGAGPGRLAGLPAAAGIQCPPPDRPVPAAVDRDRAGDGAGRGGHLLRRLAPGPLDHQDPDRRRPVRAAPAAEAGAPLGAARRR